MYSDEIIQRVIKALPGTREEVQAKAHIAHSAARGILRHLVTSDQAHVGGWKRGDYRKPIGIYHAGPGDKAKVPKFMDPPARRVGVHRDPLVAALFGEVQR